MDRQELDCRDAELQQVIDGRGVRHTGVGAAYLLRNTRVAHRETLDVRLVDHGPVPWRVQPPIVAPVEVPRDDHALERVLAAVATRPMGDQARMPHGFAGELLGVRIDEQLVRIAAQATPGIPGSVYAKTVVLTRTELRQ